MSEEIEIAGIKVPTADWEATQGYFILNMVLSWAVRSSPGQSELSEKRTFLRHISPECSTLAEIEIISRVHYGVMSTLGAKPVHITPGF